MHNNNDASKEKTYKCPGCGSEAKESGTCDCGGERKEVCPECKGVEGKCVC